MPYLDRFFYTRLPIAMSQLYGSVQSRHTSQPASFSSVCHKSFRMFAALLIFPFVRLSPPSNNFLHISTSPPLFTFTHPSCSPQTLFPSSCLLLSWLIFTSILISTLLYCCRNPGLDDQAVFWKVIRRSSDPPINPIGICKHLESAPRIPDLILGGNHTILPLSTCYLNLCLFSSGMLSRLYLPEYTYGAYIALHDFFHRFCFSISLIAYLLHVYIAQKR